MIRAFLLLWILGPLATTPALAQQEPTQGQKDFITSLIIVGRIQAACMLHGGNVLAPAIAKQFIEGNLADMPNNGGGEFKQELKQQDPKCAALLQ